MFQSNKILNIIFSVAIFVIFAMPFLRPTGTLACSYYGYDIGFGGGCGFGGGSMYGVYNFIQYPQLRYVYYQDPRPLDPSDAFYSMYQPYPPLRYVYYQDPKPSTSGSFFGQGGQSGQLGQYRQSSSVINQNPSYRSSYGYGSGFILTSGY
jgi:hypothetical protein